MFAARCVLWWLLELWDVAMEMMAAVTAEDTS